MLRVLYSLRAICMMPQSITTERPSVRMYRFDLARRVSAPGLPPILPKSGREPPLTSVDYAYIEIGWEGREGFQQVVFSVKKMRTSSLWRYLLIFPPVPPKYLKSSASIGFDLGGIPPRASHLPPMMGPGHEKHRVNRYPRQSSIVEKNFPLTSNRVRLIFVA